jgi:hypothetical protein
MPNGSFISKALNLFNLRTIADGGGSPGRLEPDNPILRKGLMKRGLHLQNYTPLQQVWQFYLQECLDSSETLQNRKNRYQDLDFAVKNNTLIKASVDLFADEATQCDIGSSPVRVKAKKDVQTYIEGLLDLWGVTQQQVRETIWNKVLFGDSFEINDMRPKEGIVQVTPVTVWDVADRLEFDPSKVMERVRYYNSISGASNKMKLDVLMSDLAIEDESPSSYFNKYLFGFELMGGRMVPPWGVTHYRAFSMLREFAPWGRSRFVNILPMFRQLMAAEGLMQVARAAAFPRDVYEVGTEAGATVTERWAALEEFQEQLDNAGMTQGSKELPAIGSRIIIPKELVEFNSFKSDIDVDAISDVEYLRDNLIMGLMIPKGYLIVDDGAWGNSGQSLLQQFKPFGRMVFSDQSDYLQGLSEKIKTHLALVERFEGWDTPFELTMEFPVIEESNERIQHKAEELTLANNTLDTLKNILGVDKVPPEIIKDAFGMLTSLPQDKIDKYVDELIKFNPDTKEDAQQNNGFGTEEDGGGEELGFGGGVKSDVDPIGDLDKVSKAFGEDTARRRYYGRGLTTRENYVRARNRWQEGVVRDSLQEELIRIKAACRFYEGKGQGKHYLSSLRNSNEERKTKKILNAFICEARENKSVDLRENLTSPRDNKKEHEEWIT